MSDGQIERYSRQILVAGGVAQERLLASHVALLGTAPALEPALRYLVGAGVGRIVLQLIGETNAARYQLIARMQALDSSVAIQSEEAVGDKPDLRLMIISGGEVLAAARAQRSLLCKTALVVVCLDSPERIAIIPRTDDLSPTLVTRLLRSWPRSSAEGTGAANAGFVTMVAVTEALKLLTQQAVATETVIIEFEGFQTHVHRLAPDAPV